MTWCLTDVTSRVTSCLCDVTCYRGDDFHKSNLWRKWRGDKKEENHNRSANKFTPYQLLFSLSLPPSLHGKFWTCLSTGTRKLLSAQLDMSLTVLIQIVRQVQGVGSVVTVRGTRAGGACGCTCGVLTCVTVGLVCVCVWSLYVCVCVYICMYVCVWSLCIVHTLLCDVLYWYSPHFIVWRFVHTLLCDVLYRYSPHYCVTFCRQCRSFTHVQNIYHLWRFVPMISHFFKHVQLIQSCDVSYQTALMHWSQSVTLSEYTDL